jgi:hypothetical protein
VNLLIWLAGSAGVQPGRISKSKMLIGRIKRTLNFLHEALHVSSTFSNRVRLRVAIGSLQDISHRHFSAALSAVSALTAFEMCGKFPK